MRKALACVLGVVLILTVFLGCAQVVPEEIPVEEVTTEAEPTPEPMPTPEPTRDFTDMAGRAVQLPMEVENAAGTNWTATATLYTLSPEKLGGWNEELRDSQKEYILEEYHSLPVYGLNDGFDVAEDEVDVVVHMGDTAADGAWADELQENLGIPVIVLSGELAELEAAYTMLGEAMGDEDRAGDLAGFAKRALVDAPKGPEYDGTTEEPDEEGEPLSVYLGMGADSLQTPAAGGGLEIIELAGGVNVVETTVADPNKVLAMSLNELIELDPDIIIAYGEPEEGISGQDAAWRILDNPAFGTMTAVQEGRVYGVPEAPFSWLCAPNSPNRLIGLYWAYMLLHQDAYGMEAYDVLRENVAGFYQAFYSMELTGEDLDGIAYLPVMEQEEEGE